MSAEVAEGRYDIELGEGFSCLRRDGTVECWGAFPGAAGDPRPTPSIRTSSDVTVTDIGASYGTLCFVYADGSASCEDRDLEFEPNQRAVDAIYAWVAPCMLDAGGVISCGPFTSDQMRVVEAPPAIDVVAGAGEACALHQDGTATCWTGDFQPADFNADLVDAIGLSMGWSEACAHHRDGHVSCVSFDTGQRRTVPELVDVRQLVSGVVSCAITSDRRVKCWGDNSTGMLGVASRGPDDVRDIPVEVPGLEDIVDIDVLLSHACAVDVAGVVTCWGNNGSHQTGTNVLVPQ